MIEHKFRQRGVTLVEMALVLLILGVLTRAAITPWAAVQKHRNYRLAEHQLQTIKEGIWAHVIASGVLPCPLALNQLPVSVGLTMTPVGALQQGSVGQGHCRITQGGVPARELGLAGSLSSSGALLDPWNRPYQLAVSLVSHAERGSVSQPDWTTVGEVSSVGIAEMVADLVLCNRAVGARCPGTDTRANQLTFVVFSTGADASSAGEQSENQDADTVFTLLEQSVSAESPFDDLLIWGTASETLYWMLRAGWLP
ncbi:type II secretion system protein [Granulosicoccus antarcticus]|uniref:Type II secretion system protein G n=1 Tax=Granulosicoccus antarcticus IMCC3135 TaxID=1192854 RepID=A0A2Z2P0D7_9GAMM|nr:type II secretion system protein [Granulosicoccus antarcticus]ASJ76235.1 hypothetical protein IMCC3135_30930 [Granulosicoccus antarcticus IMCC3135]